MLLYATLVSLVIKYSDLLVEMLVSVWNYLSMYAKPVSVDTGRKELRYIELDALRMIKPSTYDHFKEAFSKDEFTGLTNTCNGLAQELLQSLYLRMA